MPWQQFALTLIISAIGERPIYFASSGNAATSLGVNRYLVRQGLAFRLHNGPLEQEAPDGVMQMNSTAYSNIIGGWVDLPRTLTLLEQVFVHRTGLPDEWTHWPDLATIGIPNYYAWSYLALAQAASQNADDERSRSTRSGQKPGPCSARSRAYISTTSPRPSASATERTRAATATSWTALPTDLKKVISSREVLPSTRPQHDVADLADHDVFVHDAFADRADEISGFLHDRLALIDDDASTGDEGHIDLPHLGRIGTDTRDVRARLDPRAIEDRSGAIGRGHDDIRSLDRDTGIIDPRRDHTRELGYQAIRRIPAGRNHAHLPDVAHAPESLQLRPRLYAGPEERHRVRIFPRHQIRRRVHRRRPCEAP